MIDLEEGSERRCDHSGPDAALMRPATSCDNIYPLGPTTMEGLMAYPDSIFQQVLSSEHASLMKLNIRHGPGLRLRHGYAGAGTMEYAAGLFEQVSVEHGFRDPTDVVIHLDESYDKSPLCQSVLKCYSSHGRRGPSHIFPEIEQRLCPDARNEINSVVWPNSDDVKHDYLGALQTNMKATAKTVETLKTDHKCCYSLAPHCSAHGKQCQPYTPEIDAQPGLQLVTAGLGAGISLLLGSNIKHLARVTTTSCISFTDGRRASLSRRSALSRRHTPTTQQA